MQCLVNIMACSVEFFCRTVSAGCCHYQYMYVFQWILSIVNLIKVFHNYLPFLWLLHNHKHQIKSNHIKFFCLLWITSSEYYVHMITCWNIMNNKLRVIVLMITWWNCLDIIEVEGWLVMAVMSMTGFIVVDQCSGQMYN